MSKKRLRGTGRMKELGYRQLVVWFEKGELEWLRGALRKQKIPVSAWARTVLVHAASIMRLKLDAQQGR